MSEKFPDTELPPRYETYVTDKTETGIRLYGLKDLETEVSTYFAEFNDEFDVHAVLAWAGAKTSRSDEEYPDIFAEIHTAAQEGKYTAGKKLSNVFVGYGHASVADMAPVMLYANKIPIHEAFWMFNHTSIGAGQELSTRYVEIEDLDIPTLEDLLGDTLAQPLAEQLQPEWEELQDYTSGQYGKWYSKLWDPLESYIDSATEGAKYSKKTVDARVRDVARMWIPSGARTSMTLLSSARNFVDISSQLRSTENKELNSLGDQIVTLLKLKGYEGFEDLQAELGDLTKYHEGSDVLRRNIGHIRQFALAGTNLDEFINRRPNRKISPQDSVVERLDASQFETQGRFLLFQYLSVSVPEAKPDQLKEYIDQLDDEALDSFGSMIFADHTHHELMRNIGDSRGIGFQIETALAYHRDFNRHRALGRLVTGLEVQEMDSIIGTGPNKNYQLARSEYWKGLELEWNKDMKEYYEKLYGFYKKIKNAGDDKIDERIMLNVLPLGHQVRMDISGPITQFQYMTSLRIGLGGDFGYRDVAWRILEDLRHEDPILANMNPHLDKPDPNDLEQILGRS